MATGIWRQKKIDIFGVIQQYLFMMAKTTYKLVEKAAKRLVIGDRVPSASGRILVVSLVIQKANRTIVLFDGDMEIDFDPYYQIKVIG